MNQKFLLKKGQASEAYIHALADYVTGKMKEIQDKTKSVATSNVAILAALNIADEYLKKKDEVRHIKEDVGREVKEAIKLIDAELRLH